MKKIILSSFLIAAAGLLMAGLDSLADTTGVVTATVTTQNISVTLNQTSFDYGTVPANTSSSTVPYWSGAGITATNNGNIAEDFDIIGANTADWTLAGANASNVYIHKFCNETDNDCSTPPTSYSALTTSTSVLKANVAASGTVSFQLEITTPNPSTVFTSQNAAVTVQASAS